MQLEYEFYKKICVSMSVFVLERVRQTARVD